MTNQEQAAREVLREVLQVAAEEGQRERDRLGRDLTEAETQAVADMVQRQFRTALAMAR